MLEAFNWLVNIFLNTPVQIIVLLLGAAGVSVLSQVLKKWWKIENERWVFLLVLTIAFLASGLDWFLNSATLPATIIGIQTPLLIGIAQPFYFYFVKPLNLIIAGYRANKKALEDKLAELDTTPVPTTLNTLEDSQKVIDQATGKVITVSQAEMAAIINPPVVPVEAPRPVATF